MEIKKTTFTNIKFTTKTKEEDCISSITKNFSKKYSLIDIVNDLNKNKNLKKTSATTYKIGEQYDVILGTTQGLFDIITNLKEIKKAKISCAPELVSDSKNATGHYSIIIVKHPKINERSLLFSENQNVVSYAQKTKFIEEIMRLYRETQMYNPSILNNPKSLIITNDGEIYMGEWNFLEKFSSEAQRKQWFIQLKIFFNL